MIKIFFVLLLTAALIGLCLTVGMTYKRFVAPVPTEASKPVIVPPGNIELAAPLMRDYEDYLRELAETERLELDVVDHRASLYRKAARLNLLMKQKYPNHHFDEKTRTLAPNPKK